MRAQRVAARVVTAVLALAATLPAAADVPPIPVLADGTTTRISVRADGSQATSPVPNYRPITEPSISANGRYAVFYTDVPLGLGRCGPGLYLRDLVTMRLEMVSVPARGCASDPGGNGGPYSFSDISADGRFVAFSSGARNLLPGPLLPEHSPTGSMTAQVFVRDRLRKRTVLASVGYDGRPANASAGHPTVSDDGRFVAFESPATNLVPGDRGNPDNDFRADVWLRDLWRGTTERVGPDLPDGRGPKLFPAISGNGRYVVFDATDGHLAPSPGNGNLLHPDEPDNQVYVWDRVTKKTEIVSRNDAGYAAAGLSTLTGAVGQTISHDGRWIVYRSNAKNLVGPNGTGLYDADQIYLYDRVAKKVRRVTNGLAGEGGNGESDHPCISGDGRYVSFASAASNLGAVDVTPGYYEGLPDVGTDIYVYDRDTNRTRLVSVSTDGRPADANSRESCPANGGRTVMFISKATTLVDGDTNGIDDLFVHRFPS